jgi:CheY-like chemotaxis protein
MPRILLVDDDANTCEFLEELLGAPDREFTSVQAAPESFSDVAFNLAHFRTST